MSRARDTEEEIRALKLSFSKSLELLVRRRTLEITVERLRLELGVERPRGVKRVSEKTPVEATPMNEPRESNASSEISLPVVSEPNSTTGGPRSLE